MKLIALPTRRVSACSGPSRTAKPRLLACVAVTALCALTAGSPAAHQPASVHNVRQPARGIGHTSQKTIVNLRDMAAGRGKTGGGHVFAATGALAAATVIRPGSKPAPQPSTVAQTNVAAAVTPTIDSNFDGLKENNNALVPDPNAAASPTQIVEVVNSGVQVFHRSGGASCAEIPLSTFFGQLPDEEFLDPRVIYDNANNKFTLMLAVKSPPPPPNLPHLPGVTILRMAHTTTSDACGNWLKYSVETVNVPGGSFVDQPAIGQDTDAFLFGGANFANDEKTFISYVAFAYPKACAYDINCSTDFTVFKPAHYATPASNGGTPMIITAHSYFLATVPNVGYELYRMDNSGNTGSTTFVLQAAIASPQSVVPPIRGAGQPGTAGVINIASDDANASTRITSTPTYDGTRIWFVHEVRLGNHPAIRYGAVNTATNTVATAVAFHGPTSDDFNASIAVGINGTSRTIFLNWAYTDVPAGIPVTDTVAEVIMSSTDSPTPINGKDIKLITGELTSDPRFGDYSSTVIDPFGAGHVCAVTAQEYADPNNFGLWATRISIFGASGC